MGVFGRGPFFDELARISRFASPRWITDLEKTTKAISGMSEMARVLERQAAFTKVLAGQPRMLVEQAALREKLLGRNGMLEASLKVNRLLSGGASDPFTLLGRTDWHRLQTSLGGVASVNKVTADVLGVASKHSLLGTSAIGKGIFPNFDDRFDSLRAIAAGAQTVAWMRPLVPAMLSLTELAEEDLQEEDRLVRLRDIVASLVASVPRHLTIDRLMNIVGLILGLMGFFNSQIQELSEQMKAELRQFGEEIRENRIAAELDAEQLRELQVQVLLATQGIESGYVVTCKTAARIKARRSGRASVLGTLNPGDPVIVLLLRGRWAYVEADIEARRVVGWIPKKALSKPRKALLPDLAGTAAAPNGTE